MNWFQKVAPIRAKLLLVFGFFCIIPAVVGIAAHFASDMFDLIFAAGGTLVAIVFGAYSRAVITNPYVTTVVRMEALAAGDLESPIQFTDYTDCVGRMTKAMFTFRDTLTNLNVLIGSVTESASTISTGTSEIAQASEDLARRTESNAASLEETSAALVQIDGRLKTSATAAVQTVARADNAISTVDSGRAMAKDAVQAMERVSDSAKGIDDVIEGLDKIAFQTRVLAMNAAVEAGRAGDAGRGFAVVADLVSALAMRAEEEAKRARDQLSVTQTEIVTAVGAVHNVDGALAAITGDVSEVHSLLQTMASDNQAQASAITEITSAIAEMDKATQQNAAMVEETSAAARNLTTEVSALTDKAAAFKGPGHVSARPSSPPSVRKTVAATMQPREVPAWQQPTATNANGHAPAYANGGGGAQGWESF
jgi:methyl-accepting chemotaxis protein